MGGRISDARADVPSLVTENQLVVVSNRQPYKHEYNEDDSGNREITVDRPAGGLTAGLDPVMQRIEGTWVAWGDGEADRDAADENDCVRLPPEDPAYTLKHVWLDDDEVEGYYYGYSNQVLWPLCHVGLWKTEFAEQYWEQYQSVNRRFADAVVDVAEGETPVVWFQDYHFTRAPQHVRAALPDAFLMQFWHITWPGWDMFRSCPNREKILVGLLGNDLLGFHTDRYCRNFLDCVDQALDEADVDHEANEVRYHDHVTAVRAFPLSVNTDQITEWSGAVDDGRWEDVAEKYGIPTTGTLAVGVDRLDYTKGIPERLDALERLWESRPEWQGELTYVQKGSESRTVIPDYQNLQETVREKVDAINERFGTEEWTPIVYTDAMLSQEELFGLYRHSDIALVTPIRDGMNLVAKEYVAAQVDGDGVLVLSNQTGAHEEFGDDAVTINPQNVEEVAEQIEHAITMDEAERRERMGRMRERVQEYDLDAWIHDVFETAAAVEEAKR